MANAPTKKPDTSDKGGGDKPEASKPEPFVNEPSSLDETTHQELRLMHREAAAAILFAKGIQWRTVGGTLLMFGGIVAIGVSSVPDKRFLDLLAILSVILVAGDVFILTMYQFWQLNEIAKLNAIDRQFSTLYLRIGRRKSRREGNVHRYTLLLFMLVVIVLGCIVVNFALNQIPIPPPKY